MALNEEAQKRFLDARQRFNSAKEAWYQLGSPVRYLDTAFTRPEHSQYRGGGWNQIVVAGHAVSSRPTTTTGTTGWRFDPSKWITGEQIAQAWVEVNEAYRRLEEVFRNLSEEDRKYLDADLPQP